MFDQSLKQLTVFQKRSISSVIMILAGGIIFWMGSKPLRFLLFMLASLLIFEWVKICKLPFRKTAWAMLGTIWGAMYAVCVGRELAGFGLLFFTTSLSIFLSWFSWYRQFLWIALGFLYIGLPCFCGLWFLTLGISGVLILLWAIIVVSVNDIGAYLIGTWLKGPKLAQTISPSKTWSGFIGGLASGTLAGVLFYSLTHPSMLLQTFMQFSFFIALTGSLGDLFESKIKRIHQVKDSGHIIPGHGGVLDRVDGLLFVLPLLALFILLWPEKFSFL